MPKMTEPDHVPAEMEPAIEIFGSKARCGILLFLKENEPAYASEIAASIGASKLSTWKHLNRLESEGLIVSDTPAGHRRGRPPRYARDPVVIRKLLAILNDLAS